MWIGKSERPIDQASGFLSVGDSSCTIEFLRLDETRCNLVERQAGALAVSIL